MSNTLTPEIVQELEGSAFFLLVLVIAVLAVLHPPKDKP